MMSPLDFSRYWDTTYTDHDPIPYRLRDSHRSRWVRFHSLPESKRYAEDESEYRTILERHNAVLGDLTAPYEQLVFVSTGYSDTADPMRFYPELTEVDPAAVHWRTIPMHRDESGDEPPNYWHFFISVYSWSPGVFDSILRLVADNVIADTMMVSTTSHWIYHPYDGGTDVVLESIASRDRLKGTYKSWLSRRSDGL